MTKKEHILALRKQGLSYRQIERDYGIPRSLIAYHCNGTTAAAASVRKKETRAEIKRILTELKAKFGCSRCGESHPAVLDFHHKDANKSFPIADFKTHTSSFSIVMDEVAKCEVLCSNCHRKEHWVDKD